MLTEKQLLMSEKLRILEEEELEKMGWFRQDCGYFLDPFDDVHYPGSIAYKIAIDRKNRFKKKK